MDPRIKQILLIVLFIGATIGIGLGLYFAFFRPVVTPTTPVGPGTEPGTETPGSLPGSDTGGIRPTTPGTVPTPGGTGLGEADDVARGGVTVVTTLTTGPVTSATHDGSGNARFYNPADGRFYSIDANGNLVALSDTQFPQAQNISWNSSGQKAAIEFPDGSNVVYDFATQRQITLPAHWEELAFNPSNDNIVAKSDTLDPNNRYLVVSNSDGSGVQAVQALGENASKVTVAPSPNDQIVAFSDTGEVQGGGLDRKMILPIGKNQENYRGLVVEGLDFTPNWSPDGAKLMYSVWGDYSNGKPLLWIVDATPSTMGQNRRSLGINTWADKCTFASTSVAYCAVPQGLADNSGVTRVLSEKLPDHLYRVDFVSGASSRVAIPETDTTMTNLTVSQDGSTLFFVNASTLRLERIQLN